jgi:dienelactone hydrolase
MRRVTLIAIALGGVLCWAHCKGTVGAAEPKSQPLAGTDPLTLEGDIAAQLVDGVDSFLLHQIEEAAARRENFWKRDLSSPEKYEASIEPNRKRLAHILGLRDPRVPFDRPQSAGPFGQTGLVAHTDKFDVFAVVWPAFRDVHGEGLLLVPRSPHIADVIALPDADQSPEQLVGLDPGTTPEAQFARRLAESGCRVLIPVLIDRKLEKRNGRANLTSREFLYRPAFELGRHLIGYELQKVLAGVDWFSNEHGKKKIGVIGWGEGGMLALYAGALDPRISSVAVSGYFDNRDKIWQQPIDRNVFGLLEQFGDAELAAMVAPRTLVVEAARGPELKLPSEGGAPAKLVTPAIDDVRKEVERARKLVGRLTETPSIHLEVSGDGNGPAGSDAALVAFLKGLAADARLSPAGPPKYLAGESSLGNQPWKIDQQERQKRQMHEIDAHSQWLLTESPYVRGEFMKKLDTSTPENYRKSVEGYREYFADEVVGRFDRKLLPPRPRTRKLGESEKWTSYEVVLDVFPDVIAYGILILPRGMKEGEKRPVVVCQHGLEGRPQDVIGKDNFPVYKAFATQLAERGFITFAPQNLYIGHDRFRTLQRKANPIKKTLFSVIVPQHQQITDWLKTLPNVDGERIGFYGLSYGGKSAMRIPALVGNYCLSICSADFNDWVWKNASSRSNYSYVWTMEYEIFEFDLGSTFNYAEMAALIAPRPFMVERGHGDGVAPDEAVAYEFAKVFRLYDAGLHLGNRCRIEWFDGPHSINGKGTYDFLHEQLHWHGP